MAFETDAPRVLNETENLKNSFFAESVNTEAKDRLKSLEKNRAEMAAYQLETQQDIRSYEQSNHELAVWYMKALVRKQFQGLLRQFRARLREEHNEQAAATAFANRSNRAASSSDATDSAPSESSQQEGQLNRTFTKVVNFVEVWTNGGFEHKTPDWIAKTHLNITDSTLNASVESSKVGSLSLAYRIVPAETPIPFSGAGPQSGVERISVSANRNFERLGISSSVGYQAMHRNVSCGLQKRLVGPLVAQIERSWGLQPGVLGDSTASVSFSVIF